MGSMKIVMASLTGENRVFFETAQTQTQDRGTLRCESDESTCEVAGPIDELSAQISSSAIPPWEPTTHVTSFLFVADASSEVGPVDCMFFCVLTDHKDKIERKTANFVAKLTQSAGMTRLQLNADAKFSHWYAHSSCADIAQQPFLFVLTFPLSWTGSIFAGSSRK